MSFQFDDGGRFAAGYIGRCGDCVVRSISIACGVPYQTVYAELHYMITKAELKAGWQEGHTHSPRDGVDRKIAEAYLKTLGFKWTPTMFFGSGCKVHLKADELPKGRLIARCSKHMVAVIDGVIHDTYDCSRFGTRCVYSYYSKE